MRGVIFWKWLNWMIARSVTAGKLRKEGEQGREVSFLIPQMDIAQPLLGRRRFGLLLPQIVWVDNFSKSSDTDDRNINIQWQIYHQTGLTGHRGEKVTAPTDKGFKR